MITSNNEIDELKEKYLDIVAIKRIGTYKQIAEYKEKSVDEIKNKYKSINSFIASELKIELNELKNLENSVLDKKNRIDKIFKNQFSGNDDRKEGFGSFEDFYSEWYVKQNDQCYYCKTSYMILEQLFEEPNPKLKSAKFNETLHIEQIVPKDGYRPENCRLACSLCNNAKSDLISKENYKKYFAGSMERFLSDLSTTNLKNETY